MAAMTAEARYALLWSAEDAVLQATATPVSTSELIHNVKAQAIDEYFIRAAILFLLDRGRIEIRPDRRIVRVDPP